MSALKMLSPVTPCAMLPNVFNTDDFLISFSVNMTSVDLYLKIIWSWKRVMMTLNQKAFLPSTAKTGPLLWPTL